MVVHKYGAHVYSYVTSDFQFCNKHFTFKGRFISVGMLAVVLVLLYNGYFFKSFMYFGVFYRLFVNGLFRKGVQCATRNISLQSKHFKEFYLSFAITKKIISE